MKPERRATGVTRVREWRAGVPAEAKSQRKGSRRNQRSEQKHLWPGRQTDEISGGIHCGA